MMALCVIVSIYVADKDKRAAESEAQRNVQNLAHSFAQSIARAFRSADHTLLLVRHAFLRDPSGIDELVRVAGTELKRELSFHFAIVDDKGLIRASTYGPSAIGTDVSQTRPFKTQMDATDDRLFISDPITIRSTGTPGLVLTRRISRADGRFDGIVAGWIELRSLEKLYEALDLGPDGFVSLMTLDGVILARGANGKSRWDIIGKQFPNLGALRRVGTAPVGSYWGSPSSGTSVESIRRLLAYRMVEGFPLVATVGISEAHVFSHASRSARFYYGVSIAIGIAIVVVVIFAARRQQKLDSTARSLARANANFEAALANMPHGLSMFDGKQRLIVCNPRYQEMYDLPPELVQAGTHVNTLLGYRSAKAGIPEATRRRVLDQVNAASRGARSSHTAEMADGRIFEVTSQPMPGGGWVSIHEDITAQRQAEIKIMHLAQHDALTGLANRAVLFDHLEKAAARCRRYGERFAVHMLDLDYFKDVNDSLGHPIGDALLNEVAQRLRSCTRESETVARLGGDEFAILQAIGNDPREDAIALANRMLQSVIAPHVIDGEKVTVGASIGIALAPDHGDKADLLLKNADLALYKAKAEGRNGFRFFEAELEAVANARRALESDLREALAREEFEIHYQAVVDVASRQTVGMEGLLRWRHPRHGMVPPVEFIPLAEENGLIVPIGEWVLRTACATAVHWPAEVKLAVNLSPAQFRKSNLVEVVVGALAETGLAPERLELEITESVLLHENEENLAVLHRLRDLGVAIVLDDFGTGYSSLSYLRMFPFDKIKIDRSFVNEISTRADCAAIVCAVVGMAKSLDMAATAEGIETMEQLQLLRAAGCSQAQGYLFRRPVPASELAFGPAEVDRKGIKVA